MENNHRLKRLHEDGLLMICVQIGQYPTNEADEALTGDRAIDFIAKGLRKIMGYSGVTVEEAKETLNGKRGPHLDEVLQALNKIEEENNKINNPSIGSGFR
jgi:hypothetical protein